MPDIFQRSDAGTKFVDGRLSRHFSSDKLTIIFAFYSPLS
jgi:hypothetical protein